MLKINNPFSLLSTTNDPFLSTQELLQQKGMVPLILDNKDKKDVTTTTTDSEENPIMNTTMTLWLRTLYDRIDRIRLKCGILCSSLNDIESIQKYKVIHPNNSSNNNINKEEEEDYHIHVPNIPCQDILSMEELDVSDFTFPSWPPEKLLPFYTLENQIPIHFNRIEKQGYMEDPTTEKKNQQPLIWTREYIEQQMEQSIQGTLHGSYSVETSNYVRDSLKVYQERYIQNSTILVIGSETPWIEAILLTLGAYHVTTLEYKPILSQHVQISTETPTTLRQKFLKSTLIQYDGIVSFSSIEHSGLGRYGDGLNPWGDLLTVLRGWCITKPSTNSFLYLGLPTNHGEDAIVWNLHRVYGKIRWPLVTMNWMYVGPDDIARPWMGGGDKGNMFIKRLDY